MKFKVDVKSDVPFPPRGVYRCLLAEDGLHLKKGRSTKLHIPRGTPIHYLEENRVRVAHNGSAFDLTVKKFAAYTDRLAKDITAFIADSGAQPLDSNYTMPWFLTVPCLLPLGIPILTLGGVVPAGIGAGFAAAAFSVARREQWSLLTRLLGVAGIAALAYLMLIVFLGGGILLLK